VIIKITDEMDEDLRQAAILTGGGKNLFRSHGYVVSGRSGFLIHHLTDDGLKMLEAILRATIMPIAIQVRDECSRKVRSIGYPHVADAVLFEPIEIQDRA
jgi:hypothetical protein